MQEPFFKLLGDELIALTPEHWHSIKLAITRAGPPSMVVCLISSPEGLPERIEPSPELLRFVRDLDRVFTEHGARFQAAECYVREEAPDVWHVVIDYQY